jgi:chemotaxis response regulator CheB
MFSRDIVVIGGSSGAIAAADVVLRSFPPNLAATVFIALHRDWSPTYPHALTDALRSPLPTQTARDGEVFERGHVYVAPGDQHLLVDNGLIRLERSPLEHRFRPCIDILFKSAAATYGRRVVGVLLSGAWGSDGTAGLWQIKNRGGVTIVQDPHDAEFGAMPQSAIQQVEIDHIQPAAEIGATIIEYAAAGASRRGDRARVLVVEDESVAALNLQESLIALGYEVCLWVTTGDAAIDAAQQELPDIILMDIQLAGPVSGLEAARRIWQLLQIPIVYCTAHADPETLKAVQMTESYGYIVKPFHSDAVRAAIELALARRERERRCHLPGDAS